eukprot:TRINITY_DN34240_c0_g1_i3.p1 TRINITY_DN34240_c0_g1~~TRINITY_DN34240_c0_g1_i3.p1  ORF type:complete len:299 (+),score=68.12 TRINITY_DN34240_c0_g1_i3:62-958(+)
MCLSIATAVAVVAVEALSLFVAGGALAMYVDHLAKKQLRRDHEEPCACRTLPEVIASELIDDEAAVCVLAVHVRVAKLVPRLEAKRLQVRVLYAGAGAEFGRSAAQCDTECEDVAGASLRPAAPFVAHSKDLRSRPADELSAAARFDAVCLFSRGFGGSLVRLQVIRQSSWAGRVLGVAALRAPSGLECLSGLSTCEKTLNIEGSCGLGRIGVLDVAVDTRVVSKGQLVQCLKLLGAQRQRSSYRIQAGDFVCGKVLHTNGRNCETDGDEDTEVKLGVPLDSADRLIQRRPALPLSVF